MAASFPTGIFSPVALPEAGDTNRGPGTTGPAEKVAALDAEVVAIESFLGISGANVLQNSAAFTGTINAAGPSHKRLPNNFYPIINGSLLATDAGDKNEKILFNLAGTLQGGFSGENSTDSVNPGYAWGLSVYAGTGATVGDIAGLTHLIGMEGGAFLATPNASLAVMTGYQADVEILSTATNATVAQTNGLLIPSIAALPSGASITQAYGILVNGPTVGGSNFAIYTDGGAPNRLQGRLDITGTLQGLGGQLTLQPAAPGASINIFNNSSANGLIQFTLGSNSGGWYFENASSANVVVISSSGQIQIGAPPAFTAGDKYLVYNASSKMIEVSAVGPAS
jgi:hypothetical protein